MIAVPARVVKAIAYVLVSARVVVFIDGLTVLVEHAGDGPTPLGGRGVSLVSTLGQSECLSLDIDRGAPAVGGGVGVDRVPN